MPDLDILVILDRSGSMQSARSDHEGGLQSFVNDQKKLPGAARFTLVQFDDTDPCEIVYDRVPIQDVTTISLIPRGSTPLLDAVGKAVAHLAAKQAADPPKQGTIAMVITDGHENASHEWTKEKIKARIAELEAGDWKFLYLGANVDAFAEAGQMGVSMAAALPYRMTSRSVAAAYAVSSSNTAGTRGRMATLGSSLSDGLMKSAMNYTADQVADVNAVDDGTVTISSSNPPTLDTDTVAKALGAVPASKSQAKRMKAQKQAAMRPRGAK